MSRKELILVAVLINTGLLITLFTTALKPGAAFDSESMFVKEDKPMKKPAVIEKQTDGIDPVDSLLSQYVKEEKRIDQKKAKTKTGANAVTDKQVITEVVKPAVEPAPAKQIQTNTASVKEVIVKKGDFLEKIARNHHTTVEEIMNLNQMNDTRLRIGQILYIPEGKSASGEGAAEPVSAKRENEDNCYYVVKNGDSPWTIAIKNHIKVEELLRLNNLDESKAKRLKPGDKLRIR